MKRYIWLAVGLLTLATTASAQLMGSGRYWISGNGVIPNHTEAIDGDISGIKADGYHLFWKPSDIFAWGDAYGYSADTNLEKVRVNIRAIDVDNNLALAEGEDAADKATDADWQGNYFHSWDADNFYVAADNIDNHYDVIQGADDADWAFWKRDMSMLAFDQLNIGGAQADRFGMFTVMIHPMNIDDAVFSLQVTTNSEVGGDAIDVMYGDDPDFFMGAELAGGPSADGYWWEAKLPWDLVFQFTPEGRDTVGDGYEFHMRYIVADPDGDDAYGQTFWGSDYSNLENIDWWPVWSLAQEKSTAVEESTWGSVKALYQ
jgi:hypothetical protein